MEFDSRFRPLGLVVLLCQLAASASAILNSRFYARSCPDVERIVAEGVNRALVRTPRSAALLLRLHFHDCFVQGCDGSILLDGQDGVAAEKDADINETVGGYEIVDDIKADLEDACPGTVSCADLLALAAREAVFQIGGPFISMQTGRRDGFGSFADRTSSLPVFESINRLTAKFRRMGLNLVDMIALSGAHTIGIGHCMNLRDRIPPNPADGLLTRPFRRRISRMCQPGGRFIRTNSLPLDTRSPNTFDNAYFRNLLEGKGLLITDSILSTDSRTRGRVLKWATNQRSFFRQFNVSLLKMSRIGVLTGRQGEIRFNCHVSN